MKLLILFFSAAVLALSCSSPTPPEIKGAYKLLSTTYKSETSSSTGGVPHLKIYTDEYMMYSYFDEEDSAASFGVGTYTLNQDSMVETEFYFSLDAYFSDEEESFATLIEKTDKGYKQIDNDVPAAGGATFDITHEYESVGTGKTSPLDGAWIMTNAFIVNEKGDTTQMTDIRQYKVYYSGNFMFGHTTVDSLEVMHTGMGYGTFDMSGDNSARETVQSSIYPEAIGSFDLAVTFNGADEFTQTIKGEGGNVSSTETYKRLGK